jgi:hypothetical protein
MTGNTEMGHYPVAALYNARSFHCTDHRFAMIGSGQIPILNFARDAKFRMGHPATLRARRRSERIFSRIEPSTRRSKLDNRDCHGTCMRAKIARPICASAV